MPPPLPPTRIGWTLGSSDAKVNLGVFLDYTCPFSAKAYKTLREVIYPHYQSKSFSLTVYQMVQPWHPQGTILHEAAMAVGKLGGPEAFFKFSDELFPAAQDQFYDIYAVDKTRNQMIDELATLAESTKSADGASVKELISLVREDSLKNPGTAVTQDLKFHIKFSRQNGIHVSPTTTLNGLVFDSSSSWGLEEWQNVLDPYV